MAVTASPKKKKSLKCPPIKRRHITLTIKSKSPLIQHKWSDKAKDMMRDKHQGKKTRSREVRDTKSEGEEASYRTTDGRYGIPLLAVKSSMISAAHKDIGIEKTLVKKALFIPSVDGSAVIPFLEHSEPTIEEDCVRVGQGSADLRYRPYFNEWSARITFEVDAELLTTEDLVTLVNRAGFGVGICEWRPEKGGEYGRFYVDPQDIEVEDVRDGS
jgi:hypothetical protein